MPKVSVLIASYNMARYLPQAIDSALMQDYPDFEVIVLDDGSSDGTVEVARSYGSRVRYHWQPNSGVANAYNALLHLAEGEYLQHLDADDVLMPGALRKLAGLLDAHPSVGLAHGAALVIDSTGKVYDKRHVPGWIAKMGVVPSEAAFKELLRGCHITTSTVMLRRSVLDTVEMFDQRAVPGEDWDMWMRVAAEYDVAFTPEVVAHYRIHPTSITSGYTVENVLASHLFTLDRLFAAPDFRHANLKPYAYACLDRTIALIAARTRKRRACVSRLASAVRRCPGTTFDRETAGVVYEAAKSLLPAQMISLGRRIRRRDVAARRLEGQA